MLGMATKQKSVSSLPITVVRVARIHFIYVLALAVQIIIYHAWQLITPEAALRRWVMTGIFAAGVTVVWYLSKHADGSGRLRRLIYGLILLDIGVASFGVYTQRGMAARAVMLYAVPIIVAATLRSRSALLATAMLCVVAYTTTALSYFVLNFNEGFKVELYGEVGFYSFLFFVLARLLWVITRRSGE